MPTPFAALESSLNTACRNHLSNADALIGGNTVSGIFRQTYTEELRGLAGGAQLSFDCIAADVTGITAGASVTIGADTYTVISPEPNGVGWMTLLLQRAA